MTQRVEKLLKLLKDKKYREMRKDGENYLIESESSEERLSLFLKNISAEEPIIFEGDRIGFNRYRKDIIRKTWSSGNTISAYGYYLERGFGWVYEYLKNTPQTASESQKQFANLAVKALEAVFRLCEKYRNVADGRLKEALENVPYNPPRSYYEALVTVKIIIYTLRLNYNSHITLGRFDQYMYPFYKADIEKGVSQEEIFELTQEFFINLNFDTDLYSGVQQGDNGQSLMLGGFDMTGKDCYNELSQICMKASMELNIIDPKINLRVGKNTPKERYILGTQMTKMGLGFPQYNNDDIIIPGLIALGYSPADAHNYSVAACWEYIVPDNHDFPNVRTMNFPLAVNNAVYESLCECADFGEFKNAVRRNIHDMCDALLKEADAFKRFPDIYYSLFFPSCVENRVDYSQNKEMYNNYGFHGAGISNAADALAAINEMIFEEKSLTAEELIAAMDANFEGYAPLRNRLLSCPKMGNNDDRADSMAEFLMEEFCNCLKGRKNRFGGIVRAGTGSAMEYINSAKKVGATADGRLSGAPFGSSFSPAITTNIKGVLSVIQSFTKFDMKKIVNGGPLTVEIHSNTFRNEYGIEKVAELVRMFVELGGQQLQLNAVNRETLIEAQAHPELHPNLIVRVWGWSGYFNELDKVYQDHIISRTEFEM